MRTLPLLLTLTLVTGAVLGNFGPYEVGATHDLSSAYLFANSFGFNGTDPTLSWFRGELFTVTVEWDDAVGVSHNFAIYARGTPSIDVAVSDNCTTGLPGDCLAESGTVTASSPFSSVSFTPTVPVDDFTGNGGYEYYCQFHRSSMHGAASVIKSPDIVDDEIVNILDIATAAFYYGQVPSTPDSLASDLDNNNIINILDIAIVAFYFGRPI